MRQFPLIQRVGVVRAINLKNTLVGLPFSRVLAGLFAGVIALGFVSASRAATITFAQFHEATTGPSANQFAYLNNGAGSDAELGTDPAGTIGAPIATVFNYLSLDGALPADLQGNQSATVTMTSSTLSTVQTAFSGTLGDQQVMGNGALTDVLAITRTAPANEGSGARTNLLTMTFTGQLVGAIGGLTPQLSGGTVTYTVNFTSDFMSFAGSSQRDFSMTFTSWTTTANDANNGKGLEIAADNYFESALAAGAATFDSDKVTVPEATTFALVMGALIPMLARRRGSRQN